MSTVSDNGTALVDAVNGYGGKVKTVLDNRIPATSAGAANGVATLGAGGKVPLQQLDPALLGTGAKGDLGPPGPNTYDISNFINGKAAATEVIIRVIAARVSTFPVNFAGSLAFCTTPPTTSNVVISILKNGTQVGTLTFYTGGVSGAFSSASPVTLNIGDQLALSMPASVDLAFSDMAITLEGSAT